MQMNIKCCNCDKEFILRNITLDVGFNTIAIKCIFCKQNAIESIDYFLNIVKNAKEYDVCRCGRKVEEDDSTCHRFPACLNSELY